MKVVNLLILKSVIQLVALLFSYEKFYQEVKMKILLLFKCISVKWNFVTHQKKITIKNDEKSLLQCSHIIATSDQSKQIIK
jgi:hypothetical protein